MALLEITGLHASYDNARVLRGIDLHVEEGEIVSLLGRNGSGRSTLAKAVMGLMEASGSIRFHGKEICGRKPFEIAQHGIGYVPENRDIFPTLTVEQNLILGEKPGRRARWRLSDVYEMFPLLGQRRHARAGVLSGGEQQMLALCRTLMGNPDFLLIDEPTEGLAPHMVELVATWLTSLRESGMSVLLIEQKLAIALEISQRVLVMGHGKIVFEGTPADLRAAAGIRREWLEV